MAIQSLFGPSAAEVEELRRRQAEESIAGAGREFGVFAPLYRSGMRFGIQGAQAVNTLFGAEDPMLKKARDVQTVLGRYQGQDLTSPEVLGGISSDLAGLGYTNEAMAVAQNARTARTERERAAIDRERLGFEKSRIDFEQKRLGFEQERLTQDKYRNNPQLLLTDALQLPEDSPQRIAMLTQYSNIAADRNFSIAKREADLREADANLQRTRADTERIRALAQREGEAGIVGKPGPVGKAGGYRDIDGQIYTPAGMTKQRDEFKQLGIMLEKVNKITDMDVINAQSIFDYTQEGGVIKGVAGSLDEKTVGAQSRIAASQLLEQINSLPPGAASDADMRAAKAAFPGYGSVANLVSWINDTKATLAKYYNDSAERFGFPKKVTPTAPLTGKKPKKQGGQTGEWAIIGVQPGQSGQ